MSGSTSGSGGLALVTGTSSGIGAALLVALLERGWEVIGIARRQVRAGRGYTHLALDLGELTALDQVEAALAARTAGLGGRPLALVNNAADVGQRRPLGEMETGGLERTLLLDLAVPMALMGLVQRHCPATSPLRVVNVSTALAHQPMAGVADYCAAKAGLLMASRVLAAELADRDGCGVLSYEPGVVDTEMQAALRGTDPRRFPQARRFAALEAAGALAAPAAVIAPMLAFLEARSTGLTTGRHGP